MPHVPTTAGDIDTEELGVVFMHEHVFIRTESLQWGWPGFGGWDEETEVAAARQRLSQLHANGVDTVLDMTIPGLGRDPALVARTVDGTGLKVMFATGFYTYEHLPLPFSLRGPGKVLDGDDRLLESLFEADLTVGMGETGFRAAVLKIVTDEPGMTPDVERLANAVASVQLRTGVPICTHAHAPSRRGLDQQRLLAGRGVNLGRVMIGHSNETTDLDYLTKIIDDGSYLGWDRCGLPLAVPLDAQIDTLAELCERGYAGRIMLSHDKSSFMDWFSAAEVDPVLPDWRYTYLHDTVLPGLRDRGVTDDQIEQMLIRNPREFFGAAYAA
jgi:phosphotriesterase-related protein